MPAGGDSLPSTSASSSSNNGAGTPDHLLLRYLTTLEPGLIDQVYESPAAVLVVFRMLSELAQQCLLRLICTEPGVPRSIWQGWSRDGQKNPFEEAFSVLKRLHIVNVDEDWVVNLSSIYRQNYFRGITIGLFQASGFHLPPDLEEDKRRKAVKDLTKKADERWECILRYLALPSEEAVKGVSETTRQLFETAGMTHGSNNVEITSAGFQFLLLDRAEQIWTYLMHFFDHQKRQDEDPLPLLDFLMRLTLCVDGTTTAVNSRAFLIDDSWNDSIHAFLLHLREMGLVFLRKRKDGYFFTTPLLRLLAVSSATTSKRVTSSSSTSNVDDQYETGRAAVQVVRGFIIVETNFRVYAYTGSSLQLAILSTFCEMMYRFGDMAVGVLTRESVRRALQVGITAAQIISYLRSNAHPETARNPLPVTVADQIRLWEDERGRLHFHDATLYETFESEAEYEALREFAKTNKVLLFNDDKKRIIVVTEASHDTVKQWWKKKKF